MWDKACSTDRSLLLLLLPLLLLQCPLGSWMNVFSARVQSYQVRTSASISC
jgi:hypothetical protein